jgi:GH15 family glucan-1,4-alpha-glucosidase
MMDLYKKSIEVLKSLQLKNGGILATPKNGGYPYVYTRDAVIVTKAFNRAGLVENSEKYYYFMRKFSKIEDYREVFQRYNVNGLPAVTRVHQNDNEGLLLHGIYDTYLHNKKETFVENMWNLIEQTVDLIFRYSRFGLVKTERSIHEHDVLERGYEIWCNCACYRGLKDASKMAALLNHPHRARKWDRKAEKIKKNILKKMSNQKLGVFVKNRKFPNAPDIAQLSPFYFEVVDDKKILKRTLKHLRKHIWDDETGGYRRFRKFEIVDDWHWYTGGSGSWCSLTLMAARFYKDLGDKKRYRECINWINRVARASKGFLPEHVATVNEYEDWKRHEIEFNSRIINEMKKVEKSTHKLNGRRMVYWANPLGWSHAEYVLLKK